MKRSDGDFVAGATRDANGDAHADARATETWGTAPAPASWPAPEDFPPPPGAADFPIADVPARDESLSGEFTADGFSDDVPTADEPPPVATATRSWPPAALRPRLEFAARAFLIVAFLGVSVAGLVRLEERALADERNLADLGAWSIVEKPDWCTTDDLRALRATTRLEGWAAPVFHSEAGPVVHRALSLAPQVARVAGIRRAPPNAFEVVLELRRPVLAVRCGSPKGPAHWVEIDEHGVVLGPATAARPVREGRPLRALVGVASCAGAAPRAGTCLGAEAVAAAQLSSELDLRSAAGETRVFDGIDEIDVSNYGGRVKPGDSETLLRTAPDASASSKTPRCVIEWGRLRPSDPDDGEPVLGLKADRLETALRTFPGLGGLRTVRVAFEDLVVVPAAGSPLSKK